MIAFDDYFFLWISVGVDRIDRCVGLSPSQQPSYTQAIVLFTIIPPISILVLYPSICRKYIDQRKTRMMLTARYQPGFSTITTTVNTPRIQHSTRNDYEAFFVLTWILVCIILFWIPLTVYHVLAIVLQIPEAYARTGGTWVLCWSFLHTCLEPYVFMLTVRPLRQKLSSSFIGLSERLNGCASVYR